MDKTNLNELYIEEGFDVLDFNTFSLLEKHGVLSGENSCSKFASHLMDFMEVLDKQGIEKGSFIAHSNEYSSEHQFNINKGIPDLSNSGWDLPDWASWELVVHIGYFDNNDSTEAAMAADSLQANLYLKNGKYLKSINRISYSATIQHEMKHYFDSTIEFGQGGKNNKELTREVNRLLKQVNEMDDGNSQKKLNKFFYYFFYSTSEDEMSAWLEQSREAGIAKKLLKGTEFENDYITKGKDGRFSFYKKLIESILLWKDDESQYDKINKVVDLGDFKTYDDFKKFMMDNYGYYLEARFNQKASFEKYMKGYIRILDKQIKKHGKIWADGVQGVDLDEDPKDIKDILIKKREERLERIRKKKEEKK